LTGEEAVKVFEKLCIGYSRMSVLMILILTGLILLVTANISVVSADELQFSNIEEGDAVWCDLTVSETGVVGVNTWTDGSSENDDIYLYLYDPTGTQVASNIGRYDQASITYTVTKTGTYRVKSHLVDAYGGGTRTISTSSYLPLSKLPHNIWTATDISEGDAVWCDLTVSETGVVGVNTWTDGSSENDDIYLYLYDPTGTEVASNIGRYDQASITYAVTKTGTYRVKSHLVDAYSGGTRTISTSSSLPLGDFASPASTSTPFASIPPFYLLGAAVIVIIFIAGIGISRRNKPPEQKIEVSQSEHPLRPQVMTEEMREPPKRMVGHDIFICHSSEDKPVADAMVATLESKGIRCWIAPRDVLPGMNYPEALIDAIDESHIMVLIFSSHSNTSPHVIRELTEAVSRGAIVIPFRIEEVLPSKSMKFLISVPHWLDALTPPLEQHLQKLAETIQLLLSKKNKDSK
jgi:hypothetical protein